MYSGVQFFCMLKRELYVISICGFVVFSWRHVASRCFGDVGRVAIAPNTDVNVSNTVLYWLCCAGRSYNVGTVVEVGGVSRIEEDRLLVICKARAAIQLKDEPERTLLGYGPTTLQCFSLFAPLFFSPV